MTDGSNKTFLVRYRYDGADWAVRLPARDIDDAKARLSRLAYATIDGEHVMTIPASLGPLALFATAIRNAAYSLFRPST